METTQPTRRDRRANRSRLVLLTAVPLLALATVACGDDSAGPEEGATVEDVREGAEVFEEPGRFLGDTVTVSAEVGDVIGPAAFEIAGEGGRPPILVVGAPNAVPNISDNSVVKVTGTVRTFDVGAVERDPGIDLDDELFVEYDDEPRPRVQERADPESHREPALPSRRRRTRILSRRNQRDGPGR